MIGKSGVEEAEGVAEGRDDRNRVMFRCAQNIARWWMIEHYERVEGNSCVSFACPTEVVIPRGRMPLALWLGVREYGGIWNHGGGEERFEARERLGAIGDSRLSALSNTLSVYGAGATEWGALRPAWYRD